MKAQPGAHARFLRAARIASGPDPGNLDTGTLQEMHQGFAAVAWCTDILPTSVSDELGLPSGTNYARAAQLLRPPRMGGRSRGNPTRGLAQVDREIYPRKRGREPTTDNRV